MRPFIIDINMKIFPITSLSPHYVLVENLLTSAFPADERRELEQQREYVDGNPNFKVYATFDTEKFVGFFTLWTFEEFRFVEHLAIVPELRSKGYGSHILQYIKELSSTPLLLEIEIRDSKEQVSRRLFYEKNGFIVLSIPYFQPPYHDGGECLEMHLLMYGSISQKCNDQVITDWVTQIYSEVYSFSEH